MKLPLEGEFYLSPSTGMKLRVDKTLSEKMQKPLFPEKFAKAVEIVKKLGLDKSKK